MIENQEKLVKEIVERVEKTPYLMVYIPQMDKVEWLHDLHLIVIVAVLHHSNIVVEEESLS